MFGKFKNGDRSPHKRFDDVHERLGKNIRKLREKKDITQEELAHNADIDRSYLGFIERGEKNPNLDIIVLIAKSLRVKLSDLFDNV